MPQMMPLSWLLMITYLFILLIIISSNIYYLFNPYPLNKKSSINPSMSWHWKW